MTLLLDPEEGTLPRGLEDRKRGGAKCTPQDDLLHQLSSALLGHRRLHNVVGLPVGEIDAAHVRVESPSRRLETQFDHPRVRVVSSPLLQQLDVPRRHAIMVNALPAQVLHPPHRLPRSVRRELVLRELGGASIGSRGDPGGQQWESLKGRQTHARADGNRKLALGPPLGLPFEAAVRTQDRRKLVREMEDKPGLSDSRSLPRLRAVGKDEDTTSPIAFGPSKGKEDRLIVPNIQTIKGRQRLIVADAE